MLWRPRYTIRPSPPRKGRLRFWQDHLVQQPPVVHEELGHLGLSIISYTGNQPATNPAIWQASSAKFPLLLSDVLLSICQSEINAIESIEPSGFYALLLDVQVCQLLGLWFARVAFERPGSQLYSRAMSHPEDESLTWAKKLNQLTTPRSCGADHPYGKPYVRNLFPIDLAVLNCFWKLE